MTLAARVRMREEEALLDLLRFIKAQIASFFRPRHEIFLMYENEALRACGFSDLLRESGSISTAMEKTQANKEVKAMMSAFDIELGSSFLEGQLAACDFYIARMETYLAVRREKMPVEGRIRKTVCLTGALLTTLLLL